MIREDAIASLAANPSNDGTEEDWRWFFKVLPHALVWITEEYGHAVVFKWTLRVLFIRKTITLTVARLCAGLQWLVDTFGTDADDGEPMINEEIS